MIAALLFAFNLLQLWRDTNSHAANAHGVESFAKKKYSDAISAFTQQKPSPAAAFNLGTAQIAAGNREQGSRTLAKALDDPQLRASAFFNRGASALDAKAYDYAIHDFTEALKANPQSAPGKRNLEIALARKRATQQQAGGRNRQKNGSAPAPKPEQAQAQNQQPKGDANAEDILRSVQQQEQEELQRMHRARPERAHVGW